MTIRHLVPYSKAIPTSSKIHLANMYPNCIQHQKMHNQFVCACVCPNLASPNQKQKKNATSNIPTPRLVLFLGGQKHQEIHVLRGHWCRLFGSQIHGGNEALYGTRGVTCLGRGIFCGGCGLGVAGMMKVL